MRVEINSRKVIQLSPEQFRLIARGHINRIEGIELDENTQIIIKEHTGTQYTGREIIGEVVGENTIRKFTVVNDKDKKRKNERDSKRDKIKSREKRFNSYI